MKSKGFTLFEVLLAVAIIALLSGITVPVYNGFRVSDDLTIASNTVVQGLRRAHKLSRASDGDTTWGLKIKPALVTIFRGSDYDTRDSNYDEDFDISTLVLLTSGPDEIVFSKFSGDPTPTGAMVLRTTANETQTITINEKGMVDF